MPVSPRILVVEESESQAQSWRESLGRLGWEVVWAPTAAASLEEINRTIPDLVVIDYRLPDIRGDELCRRIRLNVNTRAIAILVLTTPEDRAAELQALESGADDCVPKTLDEELVVARLRALLREGRSTASVAPGQCHFRRSRLLAIDDSKAYLKYLDAALESEGYLVEISSHPREALGRLSHEAFDCVLVDLEMPDVTGIEVCRHIVGTRTDENWTAVLMLTACETREAMTMSLEAGADDFVGKSADATVLRARIRALLRRRFVQEQNHRLFQELKNRELEAVRARSEKQAAEMQAALAERLALMVRKLKDTNRQLKQTQTHLVHSEKMASLGQLVAGIAHEINNPLAFVLNNLFMLGQGIEKAAAEAAPHLSNGSQARLGRLRSRLEDMRQGLERVKDLVVSLRTFSRLDEGERKTVDIHQSIDSALLFLRHKMKGRIQVEKRYGPTASLCCYPGPLNQVLMNILANAVDAVEGQGQITITTGLEPDGFVISIHDTGAGIPAAVRHRIFEPFFTTKPVGQGTGLGLAISYGIIQGHKGFIEVESEEGRGTEFRIHIPVEP